MRALTPEQLLAIADEFCRVYPVRVRDFSALAAIAAVPGARVHGVAVHDTVATALEALHGATTHLAPLSGHNDEFAHVVMEVYRKLVQS